LICFSIARRIRYADKTSRAGVLEPEGIVEIKFRKAKILEMMNRLDSRYAELKAASSDMTKTAEELTGIKNELAAREKQLSGTYTAMALQFADLHDRTERMKAKGTIREALEWKESRRYFYWRLRRRLLEEEILRKMEKADQQCSPSVVDRASKRTERMKMIEERFLHDISLEEIQTNDQLVCSKIEERKRLIDHLITETERAGLETQIHGLLQSKSSLVFESIKKMFGERLSAEEISVCASSPFSFGASTFTYCRLTDPFHFCFSLALELITGLIQAG
jgi:acetyl-CoA carboxylase/biotin carboxylase 1